MNILNKGIVATGAVLLTLGLWGCDRSGEYGSTPSTAQSRSADSPAATTSADSGTSASAAASKAESAMDDSVVTGKVKTALLKEPDVKSNDIHVETNGGIVQLSGFVKSQTQVDKAESVTKSIEGVKSVENKLSVKE